MPIRPRSKLPARCLARLRVGLTFANVTAVMALFVALGGSSYAAIRIGSQEIANESIRSQDLRNGEIRGRDIRTGAVHGSDVENESLSGRDVRNGTMTGAEVRESSLTTVPRALNAQTLGGRPAAAYLGGDAQTLGGKGPGAFLGSEEQDKTGLIKLSHGETKTVATVGPFTWKATCTDAGGGDTELVAIAETTEANSFAGSFGGPLTTLAPGSPVTVFQQSGNQPFYGIGFPLSAAAPSGANPVGLAFVGTGVAGADCVVSGIVWP